MEGHTLTQQQELSSISDMENNYIYLDELNEQSTQSGAKIVFAPQNGKPGYRVKKSDGSLGQWIPIDKSQLDSPGLKADFERYKQLRGKEQFEKDKKAVELLRQKDNKPPIPRGLGLGAKRGEPVIGTDATTTSTSKPTQTPAPTPKSDKKYQFTVGKGDAAKTFNMTKADINKTYRDPKSLGGIDPVSFGKAANQAMYKFKKPTPNPLMKRYKQPSVEEAYEVVLDYLLSEGHAETLEEANYVMMQLDAEYIQSIVEMGMPDPIDPMKHKAAQKTQKIYNKAKGGAGSERDFLKRTGPQLPGV